MRTTNNNTMANEERIKHLAGEVAVCVGDDGTGDLGIIVRQALADNPSVTVAEIVEIVREARADASLECVEIANEASDVEVEVEAAIMQSWSHNDLVTLSPNTEAEREEMMSVLSLECEDHVEANDGLEEFWGATDEGSAWRVHVRAVDAE